MKVGDLVKIKADLYGPNDPPGPGIIIEVLGTTVKAMFPHANLQLPRHKSILEVINESRRLDFEKNIF